MASDHFDQEMGARPRPTPSKKSWQDLRSVVRETRKLITNLSASVPTNFEFHDYVDEFGNTGTRLYFLGALDKARDSTLLRTDLPVSTSGDVDNNDSNQCLLLVEPVLSEQTNLATNAPMSKDEILLRERKRLMTSGITSYDYHQEDGVFVVPIGNNIYACKDQVGLPCIPEKLPWESDQGACLDPKMCPVNSDLVAFVNYNDLWLTIRSSGKTIDLTSRYNQWKDISENHYTCGVASYITQEEFDRYTGYWWSPTVQHLPDGRLVYHILFEEVYEGDVDILNILGSTTDDFTSDRIRYPRAGTQNPTSELMMLRITVDYNKQSEGGPVLEYQELRLSKDFQTLFPWASYLTRAGWTPDGKFVYCTLLNRLQNRHAIMLISVDSFHNQKDVEPQPHSLGTNGVCELDLIRPSPTIYCVYNELSDVWINVYDCLHFFPQSSGNEISFLHTSEKSGFRHLYHVTSSLANQMSSFIPQTDIEDGDSVPSGCSIVEERCVTQGEWVVLPKQMWVDTTRQLVYFSGFKDTPLESHLYVTSYQHQSPVIRLTPLGYSHAVQMNSDCSKFVSVYSSIQSPIQSTVFSIQYNDIHSCQVLSTSIGNLIPSKVPVGYQPPTLFQYQSQAGHTAYGFYLSPHGAQPGKRYPTVLFVYGGPQVQLVTNAFKGQKFLRLHALAAEGYMVVAIDGRGSNNRGLQFEGILKHKMGRVELEDQVEGLRWLAENTGVIDLNRVAIHGWSYGGYLSLMGLAQRGDVFKVAIAGAPVVRWELYDTAYTERYMGLPVTQPDAYTQGSVLSYLQSMPDCDTRLLLVHGLIDENVHFQHSNVLINAMINTFKPLQVQMYPNERHGIRSQDAIEHYMATVLKFLQDNL